jgi:hypothetical protein
LTPLILAFETFLNKEIVFWMNLFSDLMFLIDMLLIFNTAFYDDSWELIDDRKEIALCYVRGWFIVDLLTIIPFDIFI